MEWLTNLGLVVDGVIGVGAERTGHAQSFETVGPAHDGGHCAAVKCLGQCVPRHIRLFTNQIIQLNYHIYLFIH